MQSEYVPGHKERSLSEPLWPYHKKCTVINRTLSYRIYTHIHMFFTLYSVWVLPLKSCHMNCGMPASHGRLPSSWVVCQLPEAHNHGHAPTTAARGQDKWPHEKTMNRCTYNKNQRETLPNKIHHGRSKNMYMCCMRFVARYSHMRFDVFPHPSEWGC